MVIPDSGLVNRRRLLAGVVTGIAGAIGAVLAFLLGGAVVSPGLAARRQSWTDAGPLDDVGDTRPTELALALEREDGYRVVRDRKVVYLVRDGDRVRAFSATCTHLGCRVAWHDQEGEFRCPCHGGRFDRRGAVTGGPPPTGLTELQTRVDDGRIRVELG
jgi:cytochrome b6-f complex iron-sulfur subunit/menaquinol-cytochrome c reductase iron-sulfur subunit